MRKLFTLLILALAVVTVTAQVPQGINYQAVARNASNGVLANQSVGVRISIVDVNPTGPVQYSETFSVTTNQFGLFNIIIGNGSIVSGSFGAITWPAGNKFIKVEVDPAGGTTYIDMGTTRLQSVPYALYAPIPAPPPPALNGTRNYIVKNDGSNLGINSSVWDSAGRVGIGNTRPASVLDVSGNIYMSSKNADTVSAHAVSNRDSTRIGQVSASEFVGLEFKVEPYSCGSGGIIRFKTWGCNTATSREVMRINELGNVAIGTTAPTAKLEVVGAILASSNQGTHIQGAYLEWNKDGTNGKTYLLNQKGLGGGGFSIGEVSTANVMTERIGIDAGGNVAIGALLTVGSGITSNNGITSIIPGGNQVFLGGGNTTGSEVKFSNSGTAHFSIYNSGNSLLTFSNTTTTFLTNNPGFVGMTLSTGGSLVVTGSASKPGGGSWSATSDFRLKENIQSYKDGLTQLMKINPITYHYNTMSGYDTKPQYVGVIAQDLKEVAPYMVGTFNKDGKEFYNVDNSAMTYMLINAVKEQQVQIEKQQTQIAELKKLLESLKVVK